MKKNLSDDPAINDLLTRVVGDVRTFTQNLSVRIKELVKIGGALSAEKNLDKLLEMIVNYARDYTNADGCTLYILNEETKQLDFAIVQNGTLNVWMGGTAGTITWPSVKLTNDDTTPNRRNVSAYCAIEGKIVNIDDVYNAEGFDFQGTKDFDVTTGYRSKSMLVIPMHNHEDEVIGVLQLLNAQHRDTNEVIGFPEHEIALVSSLASLAAIAITNTRLIHGLEELLYSFIKAIASAIDEKSPYTGGHIDRVAELTARVAGLINDADSGPFADIFFSHDDLAEIHMAAWMHDIGKITTPEQIVDKSTKLETIQDRIEIVAYRFELLKREAQINRLKAQLARATGRSEPDSLEATDETDLEALFHELDEQYQFIRQVNKGGEFLPDESIARIEAIAPRTLEFNGRRIPLLDTNEVRNLVIRKGTLNDDERQIINNHVDVSIKMLNNLPFPKKLRQVPTFAGMHHEKLDGSGYPNKLRGRDIPLPARILAIADVFEALTAMDRPYKKGKLLSESMRILEFMIKDGHLDEDVCDLLVQSGLVTEYAGSILSQRQLDGFEWKGKHYQVTPSNEQQAGSK